MGSFPTVLEHLRVRMAFDRRALGDGGFFKKMSGVTRGAQASAKSSIATSDRSPLIFGRVMSSGLRMVLLMQKSDERDPLRLHRLPGRGSNDKTLRLVGLFHPNSPLGIKNVRGRVSSTIVPSSSQSAFLAHSARPARADDWTAVASSVGRGLRSTRRSAR